MHKPLMEEGKRPAVRTVREILAETGLTGMVEVSGAVAVHDPRAFRCENSIHGSLREFVTGRGLAVAELSHPA